MKKHIVNRLINVCVIVLLTAVFSCTKKSKTKDTDYKQEHSEKKIEEKHKEELFFKGQGSEPSWQLIVNKNHDVLNYKLELDYGNIQKEGILNIKKLDSSNYAVFELLNDNDKTEIKLKIEDCYDLAGNTHESSVLVMHQGKLYLGCGDFVLNTNIQNELKNLNQIDHYICYSKNDRKDKKLWVGFNKYNIALKVKYEGQNETIDLVYLKKEYIPGGAHPSIITYYNEIYGGQVNGVYKTTHSGNWDYIEYVRNKDGKVFNFTIEHELNPYGKTPCF